MKIFDKKDVYTCVTAEEAKKYVGKLGYPSNSLNKLKTLINNFAPYSLDKIDLDNDKPFFYREDGFLFFLPADKVKEVEEKKWRAFKDIEEFKKETGLGLLSIVRYRYINEKPRIITTTGFGVITDFSTCCDTSYITIGGTSYNLDELFNYEYLDRHSNWQPFGVKDES